MIPNDYEMIYVREMQEFLATSKMVAVFQKLTPPTNAHAAHVLRATRPGAPQISGWRPPQEFHRAVAARSSWRSAVRIVHETLAMSMYFASFCSTPPGSSEGLGMM